MSKKDLVYWQAFYDGYLAAMREVQELAKGQNTPLPNSLKNLTTIAIKESLALKKQEENALADA